MQEFLTSSAADYIRWGFGAVTVILYFLSNRENLSHLRGGALLTGVIWAVLIAISFFY